mmetsp:Transcript_40190/g.104755  ORF Transcript_40190/g.104755 Transcript_40190/m.104755 type:complete len:231 (-) Transcript_40190:122-814(-)
MLDCSRDIFLTNSLSSCKSRHFRASWSSWLDEPSFKMPTNFPIAIAVGRWSPVIITTLTPASWHIWMLGGTDVLGGSKIPQSPRTASGPGAKIVRSLSSASALRMRSTSAGVSGRTAISRLRSAWSARLPFCSSTPPRSCSLISPDTASAFPASVAMSTRDRLGMMRSGAPFSTAMCVWPLPTSSVVNRQSADSWKTEALILRAGEKGTSSLVSRGCAATSAWLTASPSR